MRLTRLYLLACVVASLMIACAYYALFRYQLGAPIPASYDLENWVTWKEYLAEQPGQNRLLIVGDSSSLFGVDSALMEQKLGRPVVNLSLHGGLPMDWMRLFVLRTARRGDTVLMPLSWPSFYRNYTLPEEWMVDQIVAWDARYFDAASVMQKLRYIAALPPSHLLRNLEAVEQREAILRDNPLRRRLSRDEVVRIMQTDRSTSPGAVYSFRNINDRGDMQGACGNKSPQHSMGFPKTFRLQKSQISMLASLSRQLRHAGVDLIVMPSTMLRDGQSESPDYLRHMNAAYGPLRDAGVRTVGKVEDFYFPPEAFFDTEFHINCEHTAERTMRMVELLRPELTDGRTR